MNREYKIQIFEKCIALKITTFSLTMEKHDLALKLMLL